MARRNDPRRLRYAQSLHTRSLLIPKRVADGIVRLYRNYDPALEQGSTQLVSSFTALGEIVKVKRGSGMVLDWQQSGGNLLVGGDARAIRLWDAHTESQLVVNLILLLSAFILTIGVRIWTQTLRARLLPSCRTTAHRRCSSPASRTEESRYLTAG